MAADKESGSAAQESASVTPRADYGEDVGGLLDLDSLDPNLHYRFVHERPQRIARMKAKGYRVVSAEEIKLLEEDAESTDGKVRHGDTILMAIPQERYQEGRKAIAKVSRGRLKSPEHSFRKRTKGAGPGGKDVEVTTDKE